MIYSRGQGGPHFVTHNSNPKGGSGKKNRGGKKGERAQDTKMGRCWGLKILKEEWNLTHGGRCQKESEYAKTWYPMLHNAKMTIAEKGKDGKKKGGGTEEKQPNAMEQSETYRTTGMEADHKQLHFSEITKGTQGEQGNQDS